MTLDIPPKPRNGLLSQLRGVAADVAEALRPAPPAEGYPHSAEREGVLAQVAYPAGCNICFNSCTTLVYVRDGRVTAITGNALDPNTRGRVCPKSQLLAQMHDNPHRLRYPMKRVGPRGAGKLVRVTWDEALDELAERLRAVRDRYGSEALGIFTGTRCGILTYLGASVAFGELWGTPNRTGTGPYCGTSADVAYTIHQGTRANPCVFTDDDLGTSDLYLFIGDNMAESRPVYFGRVNDWRVRNGTPMVAVDPRRSATAAKADRWLPIRPGTDMALGLAMLHYLLTHEDLLDHAFLRDWVLGYDEIRAFVLGRGYTAEWAAPITDLPARDITWLAELFAHSERPALFLNRGLTQHSNGTQTFRVFLALGALRGLYGKPGAGVNCTANGLLLGPALPPERVAAKRRRGLRKSFSGWAEAMRSGKPYPLKALIATSNPAALCPDQGDLRDALLHLDVLAHMELWPNATTAFADFVLPAASGIECGEVTRIDETRRLVWIDKLIDPPGEAKPDYWFWIELGKRFGFDDVLKEEYKDPALFWDNLMIGHPSMRGATVARFRRSPTRSLRGPLPSEDSPEVEKLFHEGQPFPGDSHGRRFPTPSGMIELWTPQLEAKFGQYGLSAFPEFYTEREQLVDLPHLEYLASDADEGVSAPFWNDAVSTRPARIVDEPRQRDDFDTELITGRAAAAHFHSWTHWLWQASEMVPDLYCQMHPDKAAALG
ncbi:MAG: molybdopterin-dependent oxidoreductase, partial [Chloroflexi bacterium]|nr:molybdopterin-dependent oxidoreductase [Chloroflexota bacterium]